MKTRTLLEVDVFGLKPLQGNGLAVVLDADGLSSERMQDFARWTNFSETTFIQRPTQFGADYRVRIFTPRTELPFAGHPSIGSAFAMLWNRRIGARQKHVVQECGAGLMPLRAIGNLSDRQYLVQAPSPKITPVDPTEAERICSALGCAPQPVQHVNVGAKWLVLDLEQADQVLALRPNFSALAALSNDGGATGVTVFGSYGRKSADQYEVRSFAPADGIDEDPVCGSGNASVAAVLQAAARQSRFATSYTARQGRACHRDGRVQVQIHADGRIEIGGGAFLISEGQVRL